MCFFYSILLIVVQINKRFSFFYVLLSLMDTIQMSLAGFGGCHVYANPNKQGAAPDKNKSSTPIG
jgi:hypothetical protein